MKTPKHQLFAALAIVAKALGHEHRLEILEHLGQGERSVEALASIVGLPLANVSQHLQQLRRGGLVAGRREGRQIFYRLADGPVVAAVAALREIAETNLAEVRDVLSTYYFNIDAMEPVSSDELTRRIKDGSATLLDVRPADEYRNGHLPGALSIPLGALESRIAEISRDREVIAYCRGPYCVLSFEAVHLLREKGFKVRRMQDGYPEWQAEGREVASSE